MASRTETGWPSDRLASTKTSAAASRCGTSWRSRGRRTASESPPERISSLQERPVRPVADDHRLERPGLEAAERRTKKWRSPGAFSRPTVTSSGGRAWTPIAAPRRRPPRSGSRPSRRRRTCVPPARLRARAPRRRSWPSSAAASACLRRGSPGGETRVGCERPAVRREDPDRHACERRGDPAQHAGLRAVRVQDVRPLATQEADELEEAREVAKRIHRTPDVRERNEAHAGRLGRVPQRPCPVSRHRDVEPAHQRRQQRRDVDCAPLTSASVTSSSTRGRC